METVFRHADFKKNNELADLIDAIPFYVLLVDEYHNIILANSAVRSNLGLEPADIIGQYCPKAVHGIDQPFDGCPLEESVESGKPVERELQSKENGRWVRSSIYPTKLLTPDGRKVYLHWVMDITDHKQTEERLSISNARLRTLSEHLESIREEEKKKIAHELHDETSQVAASLNAYLEAAIDKLPPGSEDVKDLLWKAQGFSVQIHDQLHKLIYELRPSVLDDFGLVAAVKWLIKNTLEVAGIKVTFKFSRKERNLPPELRIALFRIVQESINNILKHAGAKHVSLGLHFYRDVVVFRIKDDGVGFDADRVLFARDRPRGLGILGMMERVELLDGKLDIRSERPGGTEINIEIPCRHHVGPNNQPVEPAI